MMSVWQREVMGTLHAEENDVRWKSNSTPRSEELQMVTRANV